MRENKSKPLDQLKADILSDNVCPELRETATQLVLGDGNPDADIVFIGEAPGKKEDEQGLPFVGASGRFLNEMLEAAGLVRDDVFITNIVKYRPPSNRDPSAEEKAAFWPYLMRQLEIINPKVVITLGRHSGAAFIPDLVISKDHGQARQVRLHRNATQLPGVSGMQSACEHRTEVYEKYSSGEAERAMLQSITSDNSLSSSDDEQVIASWLVVPLYHPAVALYNGSMRQTLIDDFITAKTLADSALA